MCFNPFGCEAKTESECIKNASESARTEFAAKVLILECKEKFSATADLCRQDAQILNSEIRPNPKMEEIRKQMPSLNGLDDQAALEVIHQSHYPDKDKAELGALIGIAYSPNRNMCKNSIASTTSSDSEFKCGTSH